jgi:putative inorganic carbon (HCO3(-)) transporter
VVMADNEKRFNITFWLIVLLTSFVGAEAAYDYFIGNYSFSQGIMRSGGATSFGEHSNSLAMYMATTIPMLIYLIVKYRKPLARLLCFVLMGICFVTLIITGSRSGVLSLLGTALTYAWFSRHRIAYMILIVFLSVATYVAMPEQYKERYGTIASEQVDASSQGRLDAWAAGMRMFVDYPITGVGPQAFAAAYLDREGVWLYSHSLYVELLATMGIVGTVAWCWFLYQVLLALRRMNHRSTDTEYYRRDTAVFVRATYAIIIGLLVAGVFGHILFRDTWYVLAALVVAKEKLSLSSPEAV